MIERAREVFERTRSVEQTAEALGISLEAAHAIIVQFVTYNQLIDATTFDR